MTASDIPGSPFPGALHQLLAGRVDVVDLVGEMTEMARLAVILAVPIVGELDERRLAGRALLGLLDQRLVLGGGEKHQGVAVLLVDPAAHLLEPELLAVKIQRIVEIAHAQHRMQISHGISPPSTARRPAGAGPAIMGHFMLAPNLKTAIDGLAQLIENADAVLPFTGAGISTECGIPDFRSPGGIWARMQPIPFDAFLASQEMRNEAWRRRFAMADEFQGARPGRGHRALASLYRAGKAPAVITQNIDNLHQMSGISPADVVELHGNTTYALCLDCTARYELGWVKNRFQAAGRAPDCPGCGGHIKSATISFGQAMPEAAMRRAEELT